jgi:hypothetical protein
VLKNFFNYLWLIDEADDPHLTLAFGASKRVCFMTRWCAGCFALIVKDVA